MIMNGPFTSISIKRLLMIGACVLLLGVAPPASAEDPDALYRQGRFAEAEKAYSSAAMDHPRDLRYRYNRGCAAYQASDYDAAFAAFSSVLSRARAEGAGDAARDSEILFRSSFNLGNAAFKRGDYEASVSGFREALLNNPDQAEARHNLELALRALEKQKKAQSKKPEGASSEERQPDSKDPSTPSQKGRDRKDEQARGENQGEGKQEKAGADRASESPGKDQDQPPRDLTGDLKPLREPQEQAQQARPSDQGASGIDRKRAEALLDNIREDPARALRYQNAELRGHGVPSGKDW